GGSTVHGVLLLVRMHTTSLGAHDRAVVDRCDVPGVTVVTVLPSTIGRRSELVGGQAWTSLCAPERMLRITSRHVFCVHAIGTRHTSMPAKIETAKTRTSGVPGRAGGSFPRA